MSNFQKVGGGIFKIVPQTLAHTDPTSYLSAMSKPTTSPPSCLYNYTPRRRAPSKRCGQPSVATMKHLSASTNELLGQMPLCQAHLDEALAVLGDNPDLLENYEVIPHEN